jgi:hypothetical protein
MMMMIVISKLKVARRKRKRRKVKKVKKKTVKTTWFLKHHPNQSDQSDHDQKIMMTNLTKEFYLNSKNKKTIRKQI